jgi:hypothetical protein
MRSSDAASATEREEKDDLTSGCPCPSCPPLQLTIIELAPITAHYDDPMEVARPKPSRHR